MHRLAFALGVLLFVAAFGVGMRQMLVRWGSPRIGLDHLALAKRLQETGDLASAAGEYEAATRVVREDPYSQRRLQQVRDRLANPYPATFIPSPAEATPQSLAEVERAILGAPRDPKLHVRHGKLLYRLRSVPEALAAFERALALDAGSSDAYLGIGLCQLKSEQLERAEAAFAQAIALAPELAEAHNGLGVVYLRQQKIAEARIAFQRALAFDPSLAIAQRNLESLPPAMAVAAGSTP